MAFGSEAEETTEQVSYDQWMSYPVPYRATVLSAAIIKSFMFPTSMTEADFFTLGLAKDDEEAIALAQDDAIAIGMDIDMEEASSAEAAYNTLLVWSNPSSGKRFNGNMGKALMHGHATHNNPTQWYDWALGASIVALTAPGLVGATALVGRAALLGAAGSAGWLASTTVGQGMVLAASSATMAANNTKAGQALLYLVREHGASKTAQMFRRGGTALARWVAKSGLPISLSFQGTEALLAVTADDEAIAEFKRVRTVQVSRADAEKAGFVIEVAGQALGEGSFDLFNQAVTIKDVDGHVISSDEAAAILEGEAEELPDPFAEPVTPDATEDIEIPGTQNAIPSNEIPGAADQYRDTGTFTSSEFVPEDARKAADAAALGERRDEITKEIADRKAANPLLGVPEGYSRVTEDNTQTVQYGSIRSPSDVEALKQRLGGATYRANDSVSEIAKMSPDQLIAFQERAVEAGLIDPESRAQGLTFRLGTIDSRTFGALANAMASANQNGDKQTWQEALDVMVSAREEYKKKFGDKDQPPTWTPSRAYFAPDYATISQGVKQTFSRSLGRDPNGWEMDLLADQFKSDHRADYDAEQRGDRALFDAEGRAQETGEVQVPGVQQDIDPVARMAETFEDTFSDELDAKSRWADVQSKSRNLFGSFDKLANS
jgi:hypothetical protein